MSSSRKRKVKPETEASEDEAENDKEEEVEARDDDDDEDANDEVYDDEATTAASNGDGDGDGDEKYTFGDLLSNGTEEITRLSIDEKGIAFLKGAMKHIITTMLQQSIYLKDQFNLQLQTNVIAASLEKDPQKLKPSHIAQMVSMDPELRELFFDKKYGVSGISFAMTTDAHPYIPRIAKGETVVEKAKEECHAAIVKIESLDIKPKKKAKATSK